jgi:hypothetical protein
MEKLKVVICALFVNYGVKEAECMLSEEHGSVGRFYFCRVNRLNRFFRHSTEQLACSSSQAHDTRSCRSQVLSLLFFSFFS